jgi:hypothetical protein
MRPLVASALAAGLALASAGHGPFAPTGTIATGAGSGFWGDVSRSGVRVLGCFSRRHYTQAISVRNRSGSAVTLTGARGADPVPSVVDRVAEQIRPAPPSTGDLPEPLIRHWSAVPTRAVRIRPGQSAVVQSNFLMRHCSTLRHGRTVVVPGSFVLRYRLKGHAGRQRVVQRSAGFRVVAGPVVRSCRPVSGSVSLTAADIGCALARRAAYACHYPSNANMTGECAGGGRQWNCDLHSSWIQQCFFPDRMSRWYRVRWTKRQRG